MFAKHFDFYFEFNLNFMTPSKALNIQKCPWCICSHAFMFAI